MRGNDGIRTAATGAYDAVVIGGGILGSAVAYELVRAGVRVLIIYPRNHGPDSATLAAGAMIGAFGEIMHDTFDDLERRKLAFRIRAQDLHPEWLDRLRADSGRDIFTTSGMFMIANSGGREDGAHLEHIKAQLDAYGRRNEWVEPEHVPGLEPHAEYRPDRALFIDDDLTVDSAQLLDALSAALDHSGRCGVLHDLVVSVDAAEPASGWVIQTSESGPLHAPLVVVCAGARVPAALGEATLPRLRLPTLYFAKGIGVVVSGMPPFPHAIRTPNRSDACGLHVVPRAGNQLYIGASNHYGYAPAAARGVTPGEVTAILGNTIREINGALRDSTIETMRFGLRPVSMDDAPLIGRTPLPGLFLATGTFRTGVVMAPLIARVVAAEVLGRAEPTNNPFPATAERVGRTRVSDDADQNTANLYANRGLIDYNQSRVTGDRKHTERARELWHAYVQRSGEHADRRIVQALTQLDAGEDPHGVW